MAVPIWYPGDRATITASFTVSGVLTDPTSVVFETKDPANNISIFIYGLNFQLIKDAVGVYHLDVDLPLSGNWYWRSAGTGVAAAAEEGVIPVSSSFFF